jgi:hypothetical protein
MTDRWGLMRSLLRCAERVNPRIRGEFVENLVRSGAVIAGPGDEGTRLDGVGYEVVDPVPDLDLSCDAKMRNNYKLLPRLPSPPCSLPL